jgi:hypothetical protein
MDANRRPRRRDDVLTQSAGDTVVLLASKSGEYFSLNDVGARIWELADGTRSVTEIVVVLHGEYDAPEDVIRDDAIEIITELSHAGLVEDAGPPA